MAASATMNVNEVMADMRKRGCRIAYGNLMNGVEMGLFPFVHTLAVSKGGRRSNMILRTEYERWADENLGGYK